MTARQKYDALASELKKEWEKATAKAKEGETRLAAIDLSDPSAPAK